MEKQEAIDFVFREIEKNRSEDEIVEELSGLLGAPQDIVRGFVSRTLANRPTIEPMIPAGTAAVQVSETQPLPPEEPALDEGAIPGEETPAPQDYQEFAPPGDSTIEEAQFAGDFQQVEDVSLETDVQPAEEYQLDEDDQLIEDLHAVEMETEVQPAEEYQLVEDDQLIEDFQPAEDFQLVEDLELEEEDRADEKIPPPAPVWDPDALSKKSAEPLSPGDQARLEKAILAALSKQRRQSDVVMMVCERTGMSWDQSQRLVAEVSMKNRKSLNRRQGLVQILLSLLAVLAGLAFIFLVLSELYTFYRLYTQPEAMGTAPYAVLDRYTITAGVFGVLLFLGGITGMVLGIRKRLD